MEDLDVQFDKPKGNSKILVSLISILLVALIVGGVTWYYLSHKTSVENTSKTESNEEVPTVADASELKTRLSSTIDQINEELSAMAADESSTEDEIPTL